MTATDTSPPRPSTRRSSAEVPGAMPVSTRPRNGTAVTYGVAVPGLAGEPERGEQRHQRPADTAPDGEPAVDPAEREPDERGERRGEDEHQHDVGRAHRAPPAGSTARAGLAERAGRAQVGAPAGAEQQQDDRQREADLGRGHGDREQRSHLTRQERVGRARRRDVGGDQQQHRGVEEQLGADQDHHRVAAGDHAVHAEAGEHADQQPRDEQVHQAPSSSSRPRLTATAATSAASSSTESSSNGSTQLPNRLSPNGRAAPRVASRSTDVPAPKVGDQRAGDEHGRGDPGDGREPPDRARGVEVVGAAAPRRGTGGRAGEHQREQHEHDDRADVDQQLHQRHHLGTEQQVHPGEPAERDDQPQRGVHHPRARHGQRAGRGRQQGAGAEDDVERGHAPASGPGSGRRSGAGRDAAGRPRRRAAGGWRPRSPWRRGRPGRARAAEAPSTSTRAAAPARG